MATLTFFVWAFAAVVLFAFCWRVWAEGGDEADAEGAFRFFPLVALVMAIPTMVLGGAIIKDVFGKTPEEVPPGAQSLIMGLSALCLSSAGALLVGLFKKTRREEESSESQARGKPFHVLLSLVGLISGILGILDFYLTHIKP